MPNEETSAKVAGIAAVLVGMGDDEMRIYIQEKGEELFFQEVRAVSASALTQREPLYTGLKARDFHGDN